MPAPESTKVLALELPRPALYDRINRRVIRMIEDGLVDEVRRLKSAPRPIGGAAEQGVGYRQVLAHLAGELDLDRTIDLIQTKTRQFAKHQATWFRNLSEVRPLSIAGDEPDREVAALLAARIEAGGPNPPD